MKIEQRWPRLSIEVVREEIRIDTMSPTMLPDEKWKHVDSNGHGHFWNGKELPTLEWIVTGKEWVGDEFDAEEYDVGEFRCTICGEVVVPMKKASYGPTHIPGPTTVYLTVNSERFALTETEYAESMEFLADRLRSA